jgi:phospholipid-binding lipoprotein MlaA
VSKGKLLAVLFGLLILGGCASNKNVDEQAAQNSDPRDPLESINRSMWYFNYDILDKHILRPVTVAYVDYMPQFARTGLLNMALNLEEPANTVNNLLQGKLDGTFISLGRFVINSTLGLLGSIDVASELGLQRKDEEFGEVLGKWGAGTGPYLMVPALGPNDIRSGVGDYVDSSYFPLDSLNIYFTILRGGIKALESRATLIQQEQLLNDSPDPYAFVKGAYFQHLEFKVQDGQVEQTEEEVEMDEDIDAYLDDL